MSHLMAKKIHIRERSDAPTSEPALCGIRNQATITSAWGYYGPRGAGFKDVCKACAKINRKGL